MNTLLFSPIIKLDSIKKSRARRLINKISQWQHFMQILRSRLSPTNTRSYSLPLFFTVFWFAVALFMLFYREVNLDEGWYLWASRLVMEGKIPYRDFAFPQSPLTPYIYGISQLLLGYGLYQGRFTSMLLAFLGMVIGFHLAKRMGGTITGVFYLGLLTTSLIPASYLFSYTSPYSLASLLVLLAFWLSLNQRDESKRNIFASISMVAATAARLSVGAGLFVFVPYLILTSKRKGKATIILVLTLIITGSVFFGPFLYLGNKTILYDIFGFHTDRISPEELLYARLFSFLQSLRDFAIIQLVLLIGVTQAILAWRRNRGWKSVDLQYSSLLAMYLTAVAIFVAHLIPRTTMSFYNSLQMPLLSIVGGAVLTHLHKQLSRFYKRRHMASLTIICLLIMNTVTQFYFVNRYGLIRWPLRNHIEVIRKAANYIQDYVPPGSTILTFEPILVVESDLQLVPGFEMSIFAYRPTWSTDKALQYKVINNELLLQALKKPQPAVALTTYDLDHLFYGDREQILATLYEQYRWIKTIPGFGPLDHELRIFLPPQYHLQDPPDQVLERDFEFGIHLLGFDLAKHPLSPGETFSFTLYWESEGSIPASFTVFTHLLDESGNYVIGWDNPPCHGTCPTTIWKPGEIIRDEYHLTLPSKLLPGNYILEVGWYQPETGRRLNVYGEGSVISDRVILTIINVRKN